MVLKHKRGNNCESRKVSKFSGPCQDDIWPDKILVKPQLADIVWRLTGGMISSCYLAFLSPLSSLTAGWDQDNVNHHTTTSSLVRVPDLSIGLLTWTRWNILTKNPVLSSGLDTVYPSRLFFLIAGCVRRSGKLQEGKCNQSERRAEW